MKRFLKNKRGIAMESAILFMFVVLMLGMALTSVISITHLQVKVNDTLLQREVAIEQIGENFVYKTLSVGENGEIDNYIADITTNNGNRILTLYNKNKTKVLLYVEVPENSTTPITWKYE